MYVLLPGEYVCTTGEREFMYCWWESVYVLLVRECVCIVGERVCMCRIPAIFERVCMCLICMYVYTYIHTNYNRLLAGGTAATPAISSRLRTWSTWPATTWTWRTASSRMEASSTGCQTARLRSPRFVSHMSILCVCLCFHVFGTVQLSFRGCNAVKCNWRAWAYTHPTSCIITYMYRYTHTSKCLYGRLSIDCKTRKDWYKLDKSKACKNHTNSRGVWYGLKLGFLSKL